MKIKTLKIVKISHPPKFHPAKLVHVRTVLKQFPEIVNTRAKKMPFKYDTHDVKTGIEAVVV